MGKASRRVHHSQTCEISDPCEGRAINNQESGWENTLTGVPKEIYLLWHRHFRSTGYKLRCQIVDFPHGIPGDAGITLNWAVE
jgi:hypothetical protein